MIVFLKNTIRFCKVASFTLYIPKTCNFVATFSHTEEHEPPLFLHGFLWWFLNIERKLKHFYTFHIQSPCSNMSLRSSTSLLQPQNSAFHEIWIVKWECFMHTFFMDRFYTIREEFVFTFVTLSESQIKWTSHRCSISHPRPGNFVATTFTLESISLLVSAWA